MTGPRTSAWVVLLGSAAALPGRGCRKAAVCAPFGYHLAWLLTWCMCIHPAHMGAGAHACVYGGQSRGLPQLLSAHPPNLTELRRAGC